MNRPHDQSPTLLIDGEWLAGDGTFADLETAAAGARRRQ
jgi:hypothetical protein